ncbi:MAG: hypothetical protein DMG54_03840 [Acidobacteria bacterium]|nr:MAG: hypothetical protein DMG54_03840 [Acidobacteriota bacterium]PYU63399.1 MAG: hypothetical protein DMG55_00630 [Acidobacteriota bacterium]PYU77072.1 MAG: hypothetical protein DMG52_01905 [Acidobacteriota bacterium]
MFAFIFPSLLAKSNRYDDTRSSRGTRTQPLLLSAGKKKSTYMVEIGASLVPSVEKICEDIWSGGTAVVKT